MSFYLTKKYFYFLKTSKNAIFLQNDLFDPIELLKS